MFSAQRFWSGELGKPHPQHGFSLDLGKGQFRKGQIKSRRACTSSSFILYLNQEVKRAPKNALENLKREKVESHGGNKHCHPVGHFQTGRNKGPESESRGQLNGEQSLPTQPGNASDVQREAEQQSPADPLYSVRGSRNWRKEGS